MMNSKIAVPAIFLLGFLSHSAAGPNVYQCVDEWGKKTFSDHCPPGTRKHATQFHTSISAQSSKNQVLEPVILYSVTECDACDLVRNFLQTRNVPFTEKNVADDVDLQKEISEESGSATVPLTLIGDKKLRGYDSYALNDAIVAAGYSENKKPAETEEPEESVSSAFSD